MVAMPKTMPVTISAYATSAATSSGAPPRPNHPASIAAAASTDRMPMPETGELDAPIRPAI